MAGLNPLRLACRVWTLGLTLLATQAPAAEGPLRLCMAESAALPARVWQEAGLDEPAQRQLDVFTAALLARQAERPVLALVLPWRRCLLEVQSGRVDGVLGLSYTPERAEWAVFPLRQGRPDDALRLRRDAYHWYVNTTQPPRWDGARLQGDKPLRLGTVAGYSVVALLHQQGYELDTQTANSAATLRMLALGRLDAAALLPGEVEPWLAREPTWSRHIQRLDPPLEQRSYFLAFSQAYAQREPEQLVRIWQALAVVRDSALQRRAEADAVGG
ncbi:substrate-binding periplasmic protein [Inhella sp.]|uniref:substrate-binding periplasmic protein n=1 Tax=Inhella sp. TaxID=1921806 RepID=UPI0035B25030